ncbi:helix-turn-helix domain-containing protein [Streptomyces sp. 21So2-11]|uniref:helix-turn-helix transcriptional regulator n=1 Tax=Streptomyces sp. 21So2-11 TaxID=3144408 RepID=UPI00321B7D32
MSVENDGPLPGDGPASRPALSRQRRTVLQHLRGRPRPVTATALTDLCGLHVNTVREHLDALVDAGLAVRERAPAAGRGRPAWLYRAVPPQASAARDYAGLAAVLAGQIARFSTDPQRDALAAGQEWGRALVAGQEPATSAREARGRMLALLGDIGFAPESDDEGLGARLPQCPFIEVAREYPGVICGVHAGLVTAATAALGGEAERVALHPFAEPGACLLRFDAGPQEGFPRTGRPESAGADSGRAGDGPADGREGHAPVGDRR